MVGVEAIDGKADIDIFELLHLWLPVLVTGLPFTIAKVIYEIRWSYEIGTFNGEVSLVEQHIDNLVNLGKIGAKIHIILQQIIPVLP